MDILGTLRFASGRFPLMSTMDAAFIIFVPDISVRAQPTAYEYNIIQCAELAENSPSHTR